jgi:hypothetical protein
MSKNIFYFCVVGIDGYAVYKTFSREGADNIIVAGRLDKEPKLTRYQYEYLAIQETHKRSKKHGIVIKLNPVVRHFARISSPVRKPLKEFLKKRRKERKKGL